MSQLIPIPARTPAAECRSCGQTIYFAPHPTSGRPHPVSIEHEDATPPTPLTDGQGISHFSDCPTADQHRSQRAPARAVAPTMDLEQAKRLPLMGATTSWDGHGGQVLGALPDRVLKAAQRFFRQKLHEQPNERMARQLEAIALIMADREAHSPQGALAL